MRLPDALVGLVDEFAVEHGVSRAAAVRRLLTEQLTGFHSAVSKGVDERVDTSGVDRAQIRRMLAMTPAARIRHLAEVASGGGAWRGRARRRPR